MFVDEIKVFARAGHGAKGCVAFHRETFVPRGGPSGGNGGRGGDVILQAYHDLNKLIAQYYQPRLLAENGEHGLGKGMDGRAGSDLIVKVPCGTLAWRLPSPMPTAAATDPAITEPAARTLMLSTRRRPLIRHAGRERAQEIDLAGNEVSSELAVRDSEKGELVADLTEHG